MKKKLIKNWLYCLLAIFITILTNGCATDNEPPTITSLNQSVGYGIEVNYSDLVSVEDNSSEDIKISILSSDLNELAINDESQTIVFQSVGNYEIEMSATDEAGNASNTKVAIKVVDKTIPIITGGTDIFLIGEGDSTVEPLLNLTAHDEIDGDLTAKIQIDDSQVKYGQMGTYQIVATVVDSSENECTQSFDVVIKDTTAPTLSLTTSSFTLTEGDSAPNYAGIASASDNVDGNITSSIVVDSSKVNYNTAGTYEVTYTVTDKGGNITTQTVTVKIKAKVTSSSTSSSSNSNSGSGQVMITRTGECYHTHKCGNGTYFWVSLQEAKNRGLRACQKCY